MCGIAGQVALPSGALAVDLVRSAIARIAHRGPDGQDTWAAADGQACLGHARLAIIDLSTAAAQPMLDAAGTVALVFNGEIYNFLELRRELEVEGRSFRTQSDSEVLLQSYLHWGQDCVQRLNGMFAFAIWDGRSQTLFAARDRFGEKPFYYHLSARRFSFASEIKALLVDPAIAPAADERAMVRYLALAALDGEPTTMFAGISQLPPGHFLMLQRGQLRLRRYWGLQPADNLTATDGECEEQFRALFLDSVRLRLRSDVPVGTGLSGGVDSSSVVGAVRALRGEGQPPQVTFSARYREGTTDEGRFIDAVVAMGRVRDHHVYLRSDEVPEELGRLVWHQDEPFVGLSIYAQYKVMQLAQANNVTVLLDGQGADEQLAGYQPPSFGGLFASLLRQRRVGRLARELVAYRRRHGSGLRAVRFLASSLAPPRAWTAVKARQSGSRGLLRAGLWERHHHSFIPSPSPFASPLKGELFQQITNRSLPSLLRFGDRSSMAFSRETRLPFLDHRLVELSFRMPEHLLVSDGTTKVVLRRAMRAHLPPLVVNRMDKLGFATPEELWFRGPLRGWFEGVLRRAARSELVRETHVWEMWGRFQAGKGALGPLWRVVNLQLWRERFAV